MTVKWPVSPFKSTYYKTKANYNEGYFHKIITVGTPHQGTPLADELIDNKCATASQIWCRLDGLQSFLCEPGETLEHWFSRHDKPLGPAIYGFQTGSSAIRNIGVTEVPSHAVVGVAPQYSWTESELNILIKYVFKLDFAVDDKLGGNGNHDTIVPILSQKGGLPGSKVSSVKDIVHADNFIFNDSDIAETDSLDVHSTIYGKLFPLSLEPSSIFGNFTRLPNRGNYRYAPYPVCNNSQDISKSKLSTQELTSSARITIQPSSGTKVQPGQRLQINFNVIGGNAVKGAIFSLDGRLKTIDGSPPFTVEYTVPDDKAGKIKIIADTFGPGPENYSAETQLLVQPSASLNSITTIPADLEFIQSGEIYPLRVMGNFSDGRNINLTSSDAGTTYATQSGTKTVIAVTPEGLVEARGKGEDKVLISNRGKLDSVLVKVKISNLAPNIDQLSNVTLKAGSSLDIKLRATDSDGNQITFSTINAPAFATVIDNGNGTGVLRLKPASNNVGLSTFAVVATDNGTPPFAASSTISVTVEPNQPPMANAGPDQTVNAGTKVTLNGSVSRDPDNAPSPLSYIWTQTSGASVTLNSATSVQPSFTPLLPGTYVFNLVVSDGVATSTADSVTITVNDAAYVLIQSPNGGEIWNEKSKQAITWVSRHVDAKKRMKLKVSVDNGTTWKKLGLAKNIGSKNWKILKNRYASKQALIQICVKQSEPLCDVSNATFTINKAPVAEAGKKQVVSAGTRVVLDGSSSKDADNGPKALSYQWTQLSGPPVTLSGAITAQPTFTPAAAGLYKFSLVVNDGSASSRPDKVKVKVKVKVAH